MLATNRILAPPLATRSDRRSSYEDFSEDEEVGGVDV